MLNVRFSGPACLLAAFVLTPHPSIAQDAPAWISAESWKGGSTITVYLDGLAGADATAFQDGVKAWSAGLGDIVVKFAPGDAAPPDAPGSVQVKLTKTADDVASLGGALGKTLPGLSTDGKSIDHATILLDSKALGLKKDDAMKNLGTHEFGHVLGFDDMASSDPRIYAMDPGFTTHAYVEDPKIQWPDPYHGIAPSEWKALGARYTLRDGFADSGGDTTPPAVPEPETWALMAGGLAILGAVARRRRR